MSSRKAIKFKIQISKPNHTAQRTAIQIGPITRSFIMNFLRLTDELRRKEDAIRFLQQRRIHHERPPHGLHEHSGIDVECSEDEKQATLGPSSPHG